MKAVFRSCSLRQSSQKAVRKQAPSGAAIVWFDTCIRRRLRLSVAWVDNRPRYPPPPGLCFKLWRMNLVFVVAGVAAHNDNNDVMTGKSARSSRLLFRVYRIISFSAKLHDCTNIAVMMITSSQIYRSFVTDTNTMTAVALMQFRLMNHSVFSVWDTSFNLYLHPRLFC